MGDGILGCYVTSTPNADNDPEPVVNCFWTPNVMTTHRHHREYHYLHPWTPNFTTTHWHHREYNFVHPWTPNLMTTHQHHREYHYFHFFEYPTLWAVIGTIKWMAYFLVNNKLEIQPLLYYEPIEHACTYKFRLVEAISLATSFAVHSSRSFDRGLDLMWRQLLC